MSFLTQTNVSNPAPLLRSSRNFPEEAIPLALEVNKSYVDIANAVNNRIIGLFQTNKSVVTGENWFINGTQRNSTLRQLFPISGAGNIVLPSNLTAANIIGFSSTYGTFSDGTNWYPLPYIDVTNITNQVALSIVFPNLVVTAGATAPAIVKGYVVLEWISQA